MLTQNLPKSLQKYFFPSPKLWINDLFISLFSGFKPKQEISDFFQAKQVTGSLCNVVIH